MTHCRFSGSKPSSVWIDGSATLTIAMSSTTTKIAVQTRARAFQRLGSGAATLTAAPDPIDSGGLLERRLCFDVRLDLVLLEVATADDEERDEHADEGDGST